MNKEPNSAGSLTSEEPALEEGGVPITPRAVSVAMGGGLLGTLLMLPFLVGVPMALGVFRPEPIVEFSTAVAFLGLERSVTSGIVIFLIGGTTVLPLLFLIAGPFLPPEEPRYVRGASFGTVFWVGFLLAFWPGGGALTIAVFLVTSLVSHWVYGTTLAYVLHSTSGIPQHDV